MFRYIDIAASAVVISYASVRNVAVGPAAKSANRSSRLR
jgi:hypothetical protein